MLSGHVYLANTLIPHGNISNVCGVGTFPGRDQEEEHVIHASLAPSPPCRKVMFHVN